MYTCMLERNDFEAESGAVRTCRSSGGRCSVGGNATKRFGKILTMMMNQKMNAIFASLQN